MREKSIFILALLSFGLFTFGAPVHADDANWLKKSASSIASGPGKALSGVKKAVDDFNNIELGSKPRLRPHFSASSGYNSNASVGTSQTSAAWQARMAPGLTLSVPVGEKLYTEVDYTYGFGTTQGDNVHNITHTHNATALARYDLTNKTTLGASNNIQWSEDPAHSGEIFFLETAQADIRHQFGDRLTGSLSDLFQFYDDPTPRGRTNREQDFYANTVATTWGYEFTERLSAGPGFAWSIRRFNDVKEKNYYQILPTVSGTYRLGPKTILSSHVGFAYRQFEKGGNEKEVVYGAGVTHNIGTKTTWSLSYARSLQDTFNTEYVLRQESPEAGNLDTYDGNFRVIKSDRIDTTANYNINEKNAVGAFLGTVFSHADANDNVVTVEDNDEITLETGFRYTYRITSYLSLDLGYTFGRRFETENVDRTGYTMHKINGGINLSV